MRLPRPPWFDRLRPWPLPCRGPEWCSRRYLLGHAHRKARAVRQRAGDHSLWRAGATSIVGKDFLLAIAPKRPLSGGPWAFDELRDDGLVPVICPTCQMFSKDRSKHPGWRDQATLHGVVFDILVGSVLVAQMPVWPPQSFWCPWPESNQHSLRNSILSSARLPIPPQGLVATSAARRRGREAGGI